MMEEVSKNEKEISKDNKRPSLYDISFKVTEPQYRQDPAYSYSQLSTYLRLGFDGLSHLNDKLDTPSLTFGSAVDAIITGGQEEFDSRFMVADFPEATDSVVRVVKRLYSNYKSVYVELKDINDNAILLACSLEGYYPNYKDVTKLIKIKEQGAEYYRLMSIANNKSIISTANKLDIDNSVRALKESAATKKYFAEEMFNPSIERVYQLKFKASFDNITYRCMPDLLYVDHDKKVIIPIDLKTSSHTEWGFHESFVQWNYQIQARLYWRIIRACLNSDPVWEEYTLEDYKFIVVNKHTLTPLVWDFEFTTSFGTLEIIKDITFRDPFDIAKELDYYLKTRPTVPIGINKGSNESNSLIKWIKYKNS